MTSSVFSGSNQERRVLNTLIPPFLSSLFSDRLAVYDLLTQRLHLKTPILQR